MSPKEKALSLCDWFENYKPIKLSDYTRIESPSAKQFALKVCDEVLGYYIETVRGYKYWQEVKKEIEKL